MTYTTGTLKLDISNPVVMGILNATPDSFSDGGSFLSVSAALHRIETMVTQGAAIIDVGGESTRPGSDPVSEAEEITRTEPILREAIKAFPDVIFSIDTVKYGVAKAALLAGAHIINDVSGLQVDAEKAKLASEFNAGLVIMHSKGKPKTMQENPQYDDVTQDVLNFLINQAEFARNQGVQTIIIDPGIGFGKTLDHNLKLLANLRAFTKVEYPVLVGASRKSMIGSLLDNREVGGRLAGTLSVHYHCLTQGSKILRVHDVKEAVDSIRIFTAIDQHNKIINN